MKVLIWSLLATLLASGTSLDQNNGLRRRRLEMQEPCLLLLRDTLFDRNGTNGNIEKWECEIQGSDVDAMGSHQILDIDGVIPPDMCDDMISGETTLFVPGAIMTEDGRLEYPPDSTPVLEHAGDSHRGRKLQTSSGHKSLLAVRVVAPDSATSSSVATTRDMTLGTNGDQVNLVSQYKACSHGELEFTGDVYTVTISASVNGASNGVIRNAVSNQLSSELGNLGAQFDHVMYCLPSGTSGTWIAYAYVNHWLSVYNDEWCNHVSAQMHEIGHNLGLAHSGEGTNEYGDQSGMMGFSYSESDTSMCFNGPKTWQLGWFSDRHTTVHPLSSSWSGKLVGAVDYPSSQGKSIVVKVMGDQSNDYYVNFNSDTGFNSGTREGRDQVLVTRRSPGNGYAPSWLIAKLSAGQEHVIPDFAGSSDDVTIKVISIDTTSNPALAEVEITGGSLPATPSPTPHPTPNPTPLPTQRPTQNPTPSPTPRPTENPTPLPTGQPTNPPTLSPTPRPTSEPTTLPTQRPTLSPTTDPPSNNIGDETNKPTHRPTAQPTDKPTARPTARPTLQPSTSKPTLRPTPRPTLRPTNRPTARPTSSPTPRPTPSPTPQPTSQPNNICTRIGRNRRLCRVFRRSCRWRGGRNRRCVVRRRRRGHNPGN